MGQYSNDPMYGGPVPAGPPPQPAWGGPASVPGAPAWGGPEPVPGPSWYAGVPQPPGMIDQGPKWPALRTIAMVLKIVAWIAGVVGVIAALVYGIAISQVSGGVGFVVALLLLVAAAVDFLAIYAGSEIILLFITIEKNTRKN